MLYAVAALLYQATQNLSHTYNVYVQATAGLDSSLWLPTLLTQYYSDVLAHGQSVEICSAFSCKNGFHDPYQTADPFST